MGQEQRQLNNALVETTRPALYKPLKYWGKKPVNIWREFIECYCPEGGTVLDPFAGSSIVAFEGAAAGRKAISFDINPMSAFFVESLSSEASIESIGQAVNAVISAIQADATYRQHYEISKDFVDSHQTSLGALADEMTNNGEDKLIIYNYYWYNGKVQRVRVKGCGARPIAYPDIMDSMMNLDTFEDMKDIDTSAYWYPTDALPNNPSINATFTQRIGGDTFDKLWTKRNLYVLSLMFNTICEQDEAVRLPLLAGFVHTLHLTTRMVYPREDRSNRKYSGSWGRADYMIRDKELEQNPLIVFERGMNGRSGVIGALEDYRERIKIPSSAINYVSLRPRHPVNRNAMINYGNIDIADLTELLTPGSIDFVITDPPYGGLVQYMDLSSLWLVWLKHFNAEHYSFDTAGEITVKNNIVSREEYKLKLVRAFQNISTVLKDDGYLVVTFHNQDIAEWNDFILALRHAGFIVDKVTHQYNARSGEANVSNPYGTSGSDFYIRCVKHRVLDFSDTNQSLSNFVINKTIQIIAERCEPTPFEFITNGILPEMIQAGYLEFDEPAKEIREILLPETKGDDPIFTVKNGEDENLGDVWWFSDYRRYIRHPNLTLQRRVQETVQAILRRQVSVKLDDVLAEIFREFPNGLTPDVRRIKDVVAEYAERSGGKWKLKESVRGEITRHTNAIEDVCKVCRKLHLSAHIGIREQREIASNGNPLRQQSVFKDIPFDLFGITDEISRERINQIDLVAFDNKAIQFVVEVESTTGFTSAINRCSNLDVSIPKIMLIPNERISEFLRVCRDPQVKKDFTDQNWCYMDFDSFRRIANARVPSIAFIFNNASKLG